VTGGRRPNSLHALQDGGLVPRAASRSPLRSMKSHDSAQEHHPTQWQPAAAFGENCVFCGRLISGGELARGVWDLDQASGWQILAFHVACRDRAAADAFGTRDRA
jgi:hypothetical protein